MTSANLTQMATIGTQDARDGRHVLDAKHSKFILLRCNQSDTYQLQMSSAGSQSDAAEDVIAAEKAATAAKARVGAMHSIAFGEHAARLTQALENTAQH